MNAELFEKEIRKIDAQKLPPNFEVMYDKLKTYQKLAMNTLCEFHRICINNDIDYQLAYGSLLGAVRDGGQIPWDYDVDVFIPYCQKDKLIAALKKDLASEYYFYCPEVSNNCRHVIMRLTPRGYRSEVLHVDVFYYIGTPNDESSRKEFIKRVKKISRARYYKLVSPKEESAGNKNKYIVLMLNKILNMGRTIKTLDEQYDKLCRMYPIEDSDYWIEADINADWCEFPAGYLRSTTFINTQNGEFKIPVYYDELLELLYGNYTKAPDVVKCIDEIQYHYNRFISFEKNKKAENI